MDKRWILTYDVFTFTCTDRELLDQVIYAAEAGITDFHVRRIQSA